MPLAHIYVLTGFSNEAKKKVIAGITKVFTEMGIPAEKVDIVIHEIPKENWGMSGKQASEIEEYKHVKIP